jgi:signal transduction histidine kinase
LEEGCATLNKYVLALLAGLGMFGAVYLADAGLASHGLHAETTYLDDALLGCLSALLVFFLQQHHERELRRQRQFAAVVEQMNHHIRNALQVIVYQTALDPKFSEELQGIHGAVQRIDWALREILPSAVTADGGEPAATAQPTPLTPQRNH